jgi:hypothetical protein
LALASPGIGNNLAGLHFEISPVQGYFKNQHGLGSWKKSLIFIVCGYLQIIWSVRFLSQDCANYNIGMEHYLQTKPFRQTHNIQSFSPASVIFG